MKPLIDSLNKKSIQNKTDLTGVIYHLSIYSIRIDSSELIRNQIQLAELMNLSVLNIRDNDLRSI